MRMSFSGWNEKREECCTLISWASSFGSSPLTATELSSPLPSSSAGASRNSRAGWLAFLLNQGIQDANLKPENHRNHQRDTTNHMGPSPGLFQLGRGQVQPVWTDGEGCVRVSPSWPWAQFRPAPSLCDRGRVAYPL